MYLELNQDAFDRGSVDGFLASFRRRGAGGNYQRWIYYVLKTFFRALERPWPFEPKEAPKPSQRNAPVFTMDEMRRMEMVAERRGPRDHALIRLENVVGLRRIEIRNLNIKDYQPPHLRVETAKHGNLVWRRLDPVTCKILDEWIRVRRRKRRQEDPDALFIRGEHGPRLSLSGLSHIIRSIREEASIAKPQAGFHATRRGRITFLHREGFSGAELTKEWGWVSPTTVQTYIRLSKRDVERKLVEKDPYFQESPEEEKHESDILPDA